jgi:hypothetical protein
MNLLPQLERLERRARDTICSACKNLGGRRSFVWRRPSFGTRNVPEGSRMKLARLCGKRDVGGDASGNWFAEIIAADGSFAPLAETLLALQAAQPGAASFGELTKSLPQEQRWHILGELKRLVAERQKRYGF